MKECQEESWCLLFLGTGKIAIKVPRLVTDIFERVHDDAENRVMTPGIAALIKHSFAAVKHMLEGFFVTTEGALSVNSFPPTTKVVFGWESIQKCIKHEFHDLFGKIVNKGLPEIVRFFPKEQCGANHLE